MAGSIPVVNVVVFVCLLCLSFIFKCAEKAVNDSEVISNNLGDNGMKRNTATKVVESYLSVASSVTAGIAVNTLPLGGIEQS